MKKISSKKRKLFILLGISLFTVLGGTLAYFTTSTDFSNIFQTALYQNSIVENFISPNNWTPGTTTSKTVTVKNEGNIPMALCASYTENWVSATGETLSLTDHENNLVSILHFDDSWKKNSDGYYYYGAKENKTILNPNEISSSFITGVTFNENVESKLKKTISNNGKTITYESSGTGYDNAKYTLTIKIDTIQYDIANSIWG